MNLVDEICRNAAELQRLQARINETLPHRWKSRRGEAEWSEACRQFHERYSTLCFPGGAARLNAFVQGDTSALDTAITFITADPWFFRSGYMKELIWRNLNRLEVSSSQLRQLETAALAYMSARVRREFWRMANFVRRRGSAEFWAEVQVLSAAEDMTVRLKARWLMLARENRPIRRLVYREICKGRWQRGYLPNLMFEGDLGQDS